MITLDMPVASRQLAAALLLALTLAALALSADPGVAVWQTPAVWLDMFRLSVPGAATGLVLLAGLTAASIWRGGRLPPPAHVLAVFDIAPHGDAGAEGPPLEFNTGHLRYGDRDTRTVGLVR